MYGPVTWPLIGASLMLAAAAGIHLGESTIGHIDPIHFSGPAVHPRDRGAVWQPRAVSSEPAFASLYGWEEGTAARAMDCGDCLALEARDAYASAYSAEVPYFGGGAEPAVQVLRMDEVLAGAEVGEGRERIRRYASFPIEAEDEVEAGPVELSSAALIVPAEVE